MYVSPLGAVPSFWSKYGCSAINGLHVFIIYLLAVTLSFLENSPSLDMRCWHFPKKILSLPFSTLDILLVSYNRDVLVVSSKRFRAGNHSKKIALILVFWLNSVTKMLVFYITRINWLSELIMGDYENEKWFGTSVGQKYCWMMQNCLLYRKVYPWSSLPM